MRIYVPSNTTGNKALWRSVGLPANRGSDLIKTLQAGLPLDVLDNIHRDSKISKADILRIAGINERNVARRKSSGHPFSPDESERIARLVRVFDATITFFNGDKEAAYHWLKEPVKGLGHVAPISLLSTESGALEVMDLIGRLEHGVIS
ncbi:antitoxin Xre/MbcA/ParS toxin-binding domain-containing protein [Xenorhabdus sp. KJ12.1]|uniref:type II RES/Xre toxin-antitoxin system antitoxin n=1 Tax=Xenorhabdus sp. KJ12.1 TaxID=1851571 RepID=UPI000C04CEBF|nr:antitoxin Xre/MbcA/ParS toxin-binding domain-containing protein [Xenorhabdus sp. KJ12.1]PHM70842.1 toxin-antitoxin system antitoxin component [Xenorhabdus sp. KJ12.1]